ncbi:MULTISPECIES: hypothetical protein [unclassified Ruegeria]|uniref:hypothetical protein n=1 Tax=unclassified Ruegeria TaxID=2625375 RepID=UPI001488E652|nr:MULTISPECIES: hypothetical protein [unclassified Ruegeria]NOD68768.1 hypothetical protein [Ruegeria sp. HKCCD7303]NOE42754.1 hypothetical protein [Ruegeria sp. HKCCD7319]
MLDIAVILFRLSHFARVHPAKPAGIGVVLTYAMRRLANRATCHSQVQPHS